MEEVAAFKCPICGPVPVVPFDEIGLVGVQQKLEHIRAHRRAVNPQKEHICKSWKKVGEVTSSVTIKESSVHGKKGDILTFTKVKYQCKTCGNFENRDT